MTGAAHRGGRGRLVLLALAILALAIKVAAPPGFMAAERGSSFPLVICTGHGPLSLADHDGGAHDKGSQDRGAKHKVDAPCVFAGAVAPPTAAFTPVIASTYSHATPPPLFRADLTPGRGLAAPPPPSQGPPLLL